VTFILTRDDDLYVTLPDRAHLANSRNASLFLSLHVNHAPDAKVEGIESYILSPEATDDEAKKLALLENDTWLKSAKIGDAGNDIRKILIDIEQEKYIQDSALIASMAMQEMGPLDSRRGLKSRGVKQAMFYVLSQVAMPSLLVEMAFLSNTGDRGRLMNVEFRDDFVQALVTALKRYTRRQ
jgi:N-acetylmuramoyl-L-alanine amidase